MEIFQTSVFFISIAVVLFCIAVIIMVNAVENDEQEIITEIAVAVIVFACAFGIVSFTYPYNETIYFETDYNIVEMVENSQYKVTTSGLSSTEIVDYVRFREYIFGRKRLKLHTNDKNKYFSALETEKQKFEKYKK